MQRSFKHYLLLVSSLLERGELDLDERLQVEGRHTSLLGVHLLDLLLGLKGRLRSCNFRFLDWSLRPRLGGGLLLVGGRSLLGSHDIMVFCWLRLGRDCNES